MVWHLWGCCKQLSEKTLHQLTVTILKYMDEPLINFFFCILLLPQPPPSPVVSVQDWAWAHPPLHPPCPEPDCWLLRSAAASPSPPPPHPHQVLSNDLHRDNDCDRGSERTKRREKRDFDKHNNLEVWSVNQRITERLNLTFKNMCVNVTNLTKEWFNQKHRAQEEIAGWTFAHFFLAVKRKTCQQHRRYQFRSKCSCNWISRSMP